MATITVVPDSGLNVGDTITVTPTGAPKGKNYISVAVFPGGAPAWTARVVTRNNDPASITLGGAGLMYVWFDSDSDMSNGFDAVAVGTVEA